jgi:hypothetical protein
MFLRRGVWPARSLRGANLSFAFAVLLFGVAAAPFCRCNCDEHGAAAAAEAPSCHGHAGHHGAKPAPGHPCEHAGCSGVSATIPVLPGQSLLASAPEAPVAATFAPLALHVVTDEVALMRPRLDRDVGLPVPTSLFTILRP